MYIGTENSPRPATTEEQQSIHDQSTAVAPSSASGSSLTPATGAVLPSSSSSAGAATTSAATTSSNKLDPGVLDAIMGKSDGQRMLEAVRDLKSQGQFSLEQKLNIWDELELVGSFSLRRGSIAFLYIMS